MKQRRRTVEEDLIAGPLLQKEIYYQDFSERNLNPAHSKIHAEETHIIVSVYKFRILVAQYDTTDQAWAIVGDSFHSIEVCTPRTATERALNATLDADILETIEKGFPGPMTIDKWLEFCRENICSISIEEEGPASEDLIRRFSNSTTNQEIL